MQQHSSENNGLTAMLGKAKIAATACESTVHSICTGEKPRESLRVLVVEDDKTLAGLLAKCFGEHGYLQDVAYSCREASMRFTDGEYDIAVLDHHLPDGLGDLLLRAFRAENQDCVCVMITTDPNPKLALEWIQAGAAAYLRKPFDPEYLVEQCTRAFRERALLRVKDLLEERTQALHNSEEIQVLQTITEVMGETVGRRQALESREKKSKERRLLLDTIDTQVWSLTDTETYGRLNRAHADFLGLDIKNIAYKRLEEFLSAKEANVCKTSNIEVFKTRRPVYTEEWLTNANGQDRLLAITKTPTLDENENVEYVVCTGTDITERKRVEAALDDSRRRLEYVIAGTNVGTWEWNVQTGQTVFNERWADIIGYTLEEISPVSIDTWVKFCHPDDMAESERLLKECFDGRSEYYNCECRMRHKDGSWVWVLDRGKLFTRTGDGKPEWMFGTHLNITLRKNAEEEVRAQHEFSESLIETAQAIILVLDTKGRILRFNSYMEELTGWGLDEVKGKNWFEIFVKPEEDPVIKPLFKKAIDGIPTRGHVGCIITRDGREVFIEWYDKTLKNKDGNTIGLLAVGQDVTERMRTEQRLRESENNLRLLFDSIGDIMIVASLEGHILFSNQTAKEKLGYSDSELSKMHLLEWHRPEDREEAEGIFTAILKGRRKDCPLPLSTKDGLLIPAETRVWLGKWSGADCVYGICKDLSVEQEAQQRFERIFYSNPSPMALSTMPDRCFFNVNQAFVNVIGYAPEEIIGKTANDIGLFTDANVQSIISDTLESDGRISDIELKIRCKDGTLRDGLFWGEVIRNQGRRFFLSLMLDITEKKRLEAERRNLENRLHQREKTDSLSRMAGAVAHLFNNSLTAVIGNLQLLAEDLSPDETSFKYLKKAQMAARRATDTSGRMLTLLGYSRGEPARIDLADVCRRSLAKLEADIPTGAAMIWDMTDLGPVVRADANQFDQVVSALVTNAWEALDPAGKVRVSVGTVNSADIPEMHRFPVEWEPAVDRYACLSVTDTGRGLAPETIRRIFDPFFSDKFIGRGLGLAVVLGIVKSWNGCLAVESAPGRGSVFRMFLPLSPEGVSHLEC